MAITKEQLDFINNHSLLTTMQQEAVIANFGSVSSKNILEECMKFAESIYVSKDSNLKKDLNDLIRTLNDNQKSSFSHCLKLHKENKIAFTMDKKLTITWYKGAFKNYYAIVLLPAKSLLQYTLNE